MAVSHVAASIPVEEQQLRWQQATYFLSDYLCTDFNRAQRYKF